MVATAVHVSMHAQRAKERIEQHRNGQLVSLIVALCTPMQVPAGKQSLPQKIGAVVHNQYMCRNYAQRGGRGRGRPRQGI